MKKIIYSFAVVILFLTPFGFGLNGSTYSTQLLKPETKITLANTEDCQPGQSWVVPGPGKGVAYCVDNRGWNGPNPITDPIDALFYALAVVLLKIGGIFVFLTGIILNYSIKYTIIEMSMWVTQMPALQVGWSTFRDLANIFFIFILIWIAISTILNLKSHATMGLLVKIIIVALLINFSLFFTKVIIDTSNIVTIQFYNAMTRGYTNFDDIDNGIAMVFQVQTGVNTFFPNGGITDGRGGANDVDYSKILPDNSSYLTIGLMGLIFMIISSFVFLAAAILLATRFVILIFLMITAPLAYVGSILPMAGGYSKKWWDTLFEQCIFAPVMMMFLWFTATVIKSPIFQAILGNGVTAGSETTASIATAINAGAADSVGVIFNFIIVTIFMVASLIVAKNAGAVGGGWAVKSAKTVAGMASFGAAGWIGRRTVGAGAYAAAERLKDTGFGTTRFGTAMTRGLRGVAGGSFDVRATSGGKSAGLGTAAGKGGFTEIRKEEVKRREDYSKSLGKTPIIQKDAKPAYEKTKSDLANDKEEVEKLDREIAEIIKVGGDAKPKIAERDLARTTVKRTETRLEEFETNQNLGTNKQAAYAAGLAGEGRFGKKASAGTHVVNVLSWITLRRWAQKASAKKIREGMKKTPTKRLREALRNFGIGTPPTPGTTPPGTPPSGATTP